MWFAPRCGIGLNDSLGRRCPTPAPNPLQPNPEPKHYNNLAQLGRALELRSANYSSRVRGASPGSVRSRPGRPNLAEGHACPKPRCCRTDCRCLHRAREVQTLRINEALQIAWNPATTVRET